MDTVYTYEVFLYYIDEDKRVIERGIVLATDFADAVAQVTESYDYVDAIKCEKFLPENGKVLSADDLKCLGYTQIQTGDPNNIGYTPVG